MADSSFFVPVFVPLLFKICFFFWGLGVGVVVLLLLFVPCCCCRSLVCWLYLGRSACDPAGERGPAPRSERWRFEVRHVDTGALD